ncbi:hypothetical protein [Simiduia aestuariiviva]|uniref:Lipoprotein n=1 Tax=Simiduia aestuariiviva TaxID=1510459 RepID=A0A839UQ96_9GAMM|nr:hypothetical protein [Simiduia aestuariiviva]MBB3168649.1 hypothetical protein [Simiduia aestuariiviva]
MTRLMVAVAIIGWALVGCSEKPADSEQAQGAIPEHQLKALEKAKSVEDTLQAAETERRARAEQDERLRR